MKKVKKLLALILVFVLCLSCLAACATTEQPNDTKPAQQPNGGTTPGGNTPADPGSSTSEPLTVWIEKVFSEDANNRLVEAIEKYSQDTGVQINVELVNSTDFVTNMNAAVEAGTMPDISTADIRKVLNYYPSNPYLDVTDLVNSIHAENPIMDSIYNTSQIDNRFFFVPFDSSADLLFIRKDKMEAAGVTEVPRTWEELFELAEKITDPDNDFYGLGMTAGVGDGDGENAMRVMMWNYGGGLFNPDGTANANNEVSRYIFGKYLELYNKGVIPESAISWTASDNNGNYLLGTVGIVINACTLYTAMRDNPDYAELLENTIVTTGPAGPDNGRKMLYIYGWGIHNTCKNVDAAYDLIRYLVSEEVYTNYLDLIAPVYAPVYVNVAASDTWSEGVYKTMAEYAASSDAYIGYPCSDRDTLAVASQVYNAFAFTNALNAMVAGKATVEEALEQINTEITNTANNILG